MPPKTTKPKTQKVAASAASVTKPEAGNVVVRTSLPAFRRAGLEFSNSEPVSIPVEELSDEQYELLINEPLLVVSVEAPAAAVSTPAS